MSISNILSQLNEGLVRYKLTTVNIFIHFFTLQYFIIRRLSTCSSNPQSPSMISWPSPAFMSTTKLTPNKLQNPPKTHLLLNSCYKQACIWLMHTQTHSIVYNILQLCICRCKAINYRKSACFISLYFLIFSIRFLFVIYKLLQKFICFLKDFDITKLTQMNKTDFVYILISRK